MRDVERLREKRQFSLDDRQLASIALCTLLLFGVVFGLGVTLGKRLARADGSPAPADLARLDEVARKMPAAAKVAPKPALPPDAAPAAANTKAEVAHATAARAPVVVPPPPKPVQVASIVPAPALTPPPKDLGPFTIQLGASQDRADAARLESRARSAGLAPYVVEADLGRKGLWYRVRVGSFSDKEAATRYRRDVERELGSRAVVMATR